MVQLVPVALEDLQHPYVLELQVVLVVQECQDLLLDQVFLLLQQVPEVLCHLLFLEVLCVL